MGLRYGDPSHAGFGHLRVLNEDRVDSGTGFGSHPHREFEIFSYIVDGGLEQCVVSPPHFIHWCAHANSLRSVISGDSMGNTEVLQRGDLQMTSAGTGIRHSEKCHGPKQAHFLQIWANPNQSNLTPKYYTRSVFTFFLSLPHFPQHFLIRTLTDRTPHTVYLDISRMTIKGTNGRTS